MTTISQPDRLELKLDATGEYLLALTNPDTSRREPWQAHMVLDEQGLIRHNTLSFQYTGRTILAYLAVRQSVTPNQLLRLLPVLPASAPPVSFSDKAPWPTHFLPEQECWVTNYGWYPLRRYLDTYSQLPSYLVADYQDPANMKTRHLLMNAGGYDMMLGTYIWDFPQADSSPSNLPSEQPIDEATLVTHLTIPYLELLLKEAFAQGSSAGTSSINEHIGFDNNMHKQMEDGYINQTIDAIKKMGNTRVIGGNVSIGHPVHMKGGIIEL
jgi:hypothetical protein